MLIQLRDELADWLVTQRVAVAPFPPPTDDELLVATNIVFQYRPIDLLNYLETFWSTTQSSDRGYLGLNNNDEQVRRALGEPTGFGLGPHSANPVYDRPAMPRLAGIPAGLPPLQNPDNFQPDPVWKHLIYAYAIENTRIIDVFRRVLREMLTGEQLGRPNATVLSWLRTTEDVFFTDRLGHWIFSPISRLRDDPAAIRRNAYYRMFGLDLNHGTDDGRPYPYQKPEMANRDFVRTFEQLLRETWRAYTNRRNKIGADTTDTAAITDLVLRLRDMLRDRRLSGLLAREEFYSVATLSWFHLTVSSNNEVMTLLQAQGNNSAERLRSIGERVGLPAHTRSYNYFLMANELSTMLSRFENWNPNVDNVVGLYDDVGIPLNPIPNLMLTIINHWSAATGRNLKEPGLYLPETSFAVSRSPVQQGGNGYHSLAKAK